MEPLADRPALSVVVPAYNEAGRIEGTLDGIRSHLARRAGGYEILVAADGDDGTREKVATPSPPGSTTITPAGRPPTWAKIPAPRCKLAAKVSAVSSMAVEGGSTAGRAPNAL